MQQRPFLLHWLPNVVVALCHFRRVAMHNPVPRCVRNSVAVFYCGFLRSLSHCELQISAITFGRGQRIRTWRAKNLNPVQPAVGAKNSSRNIWRFHGQTRDLGTVHHFLPQWSSSSKHGGNLEMKYFRGIRPNTLYSIHESFPAGNPLITSGECHTTHGIKLNRFVTTSIQLKVRSIVTKLSD